MHGVFHMCILVSGNILPAIAIKELEKQLIFITSLARSSLLTNGYFSKVEEFIINSERVKRSPDFVSFKELVKENLLRKQFYSIE